jgi:hypothetical protein
MFSLENELRKRQDIIANKTVLVEKKEELEKDLAILNEELGKYDYAELEEEIAEIKRLMGVEDEVVEEEASEEVVGE